MNNLFGGGEMNRLLRVVVIPAILGLRDRMPPYSRLL